MLHVVLTRFNIATPGREAPIRNSPGWLARRFDLFERYCLPSMAAQTVRDFTWLIYFDRDTPAEFRARIDRARCLVPFEPRFVPMLELADVIAEVAGLARGQSLPLITTRLDNDDAVARDFLERVRLAASAVPGGTVLNFTTGIALRDGRVYSAIDRSNPFTSLVERQHDPIRTIWSAQHQSLGSLWPIEQVEGHPAWLQVVHGENVTNRIKGRRLPGAALHETFGLAPGITAQPAGKSAILVDNLIVSPLRSLRETAFRVAKPAARALLGQR